jgi:hypothetical protein
VIKHLTPPPAAEFCRKRIYDLLPLPAGNWLSRRCLDVFTGVRPVAAAEVLRKLLPSCPGLHLWLVKPPHSR